MVLNPVETTEMGSQLEALVIERWSRYQLVASNEERSEVTHKAEKIAQKRHLRLVVICFYLLPQQGPQLFALP